MRAKSNSCAAGAAAIWAALSATLFAIAALGGEAAAQGAITVVPTRIVFEERDRASVVTLVNRGAVPETYRIFFRNQRMTEDGKFVEIKPGETPASGELFADEMVVHSPRQIRLEPGVSQSVRLMVRKPADLAPGEYRSHLVFQVVPEERTGQSVEAPQGEDQIAIELIPLYGVSIPVIVRHGALDATVSFREMKLSSGADGRLAAKFVIERTGTRSVYGDLVASVRLDGRDPIVLGQINGIAVYSPNPQRQVTIPLNVPEGTSISGSRIDITYKEADGASRILAAGEAAAP